MIGANANLFSKLYPSKAPIFSQGTDSHTTFNRIKAHKDILQILKRVLTCKI